MVSDLVQQGLSNRYIQKPNFQLPDPLQPLRHWLNRIEIHSTKAAHLLCKLIPTQCPFERDIVVFGRKVARIPPLCKLNPLFEEVTNLRFRALCYLAECGEDVHSYC